MSANKIIKMLSNSFSLYVRGFLAIFLVIFAINIGGFRSYLGNFIKADYVTVLIPACTLQLYFAALIGKPFERYDYCILVCGLLLISSNISLPVNVYLFVIAIALIVLLLAHISRIKSSLNNNKKA